MNKEKTTKKVNIKPSWIILLLSGLLILAGLPNSLATKFNYWLFVRFVYLIGVILFILDK